MEQILHMITMMAPYLLLGFFLAGIMHVFVPASLFRKHMSQPNFKSVMLSTLIGIPIPLCSCGVIPTAMSLRKEGASHGAVISFLIATPQTGVDSILATNSMMGLPIALVRPIAALFTAVFGGVMSNISDHFHPKGAVVEQKTLSAEDAKKQVSFWEKMKEVFHYAYFEMMQDIGKWLVIGLAIAALITYIPDAWLLSFKGNTLLSILIVLLCAIPMYVCATGSIPIAIALMMKGLSPGAALVLLMAGPAVNMASMLVIKKVMGTRSLLVYLASIIIGATLFALGVDAIEFNPATEGFFTKHLIQSGACCTPAGIPWFRWVFAAILLILLANALIRRYLVKPQTKELQAVAGDVAIHIDGMKCNHCLANAQKAIEGVAGVTGVEIDLASGNAIVKGSFDMNALKAAIEGIGFSVRANGTAPAVQLLKITGMKCNHCAANAQKALEGVAGVESVEIDLAAGTAAIKGQFDPAEAIAAVVGLGFTAQFQADAGVCAVPAVQLIHIKGMKCNHCAANAQKAIEGVAGVESVEIDLAAGTAAIKGDYALSEVIAAVEGLGFSVVEQTSSCCSTSASASEEGSCGCNVKEN